MKTFNKSFSPIKILIILFLFIFCGDHKNVLFSNHLSVSETLTSRFFPKLTREIRLATNPHSYTPTIQSLSVPDSGKFFSPGEWLDYRKNCVFSSRMNILKYAGILPPEITIDEFIKKVNDENLLYNKWKINKSDHPFTTKMINEINRYFNKESTFSYRWYSLKSIDELIYVASLGHHVLIYNQVWIKPDSLNGNPRLHLGSYAHVSTVTGIKSFDQENGIIEFSVFDPLPLKISSYPVYNKLTGHGWNNFGYQSIPYIVKNGRKARSGYIIRVE